jgi:hypothetical protein
MRLVDAARWREPHRVDHDSDIGQLVVGYGVDLFVQLLARCHAPSLAQRPPKSPGVKR